MILQDIKISWDFGYRCTHTSIIKGKTQLTKKNPENSVYLGLDFGFEETLFNVQRLKLLKLA